jgi:hypothetical protein
MSFFSRGSNGRNNRGRGNWQTDHRRPRFSIHFDVDLQESNQRFQAALFYLVGHGILHPRPDRPPFQPPRNFSGILIPPHVSLYPKVPTNDGWQEIVHQYVSHHRGWPTVSLPLPPPINPNVQIAPVISQVQSSHTSKILKTNIPQHMQDKGKAVISPSIPST